MTEVQEKFCVGVIGSEGTKGADAPGSEAPQNAGEPVDRKRLRSGSAVAASSTGTPDLHMPYGLRARPNQLRRRYSNIAPQAGLTLREQRLDVCRHARGSLECAAQADWRAAHSRRMDCAWRKLVAVACAHVAADGGSSILTRIARIPSCRAGSMSFNSESPTITHSAGEQPAAARPA
jgi:hypothetical protein